MTNSNFIDRIKLEELINPDYTFFIPSYQRGYRWDTKQVLELLGDIDEAELSGLESYCLQPIVVKTLQVDSLFEVIDGQQRLTTIYLIMLRLSTDPGALFHIDYETRKECTAFLVGLKDNQTNYENPDFAHISEAYGAIGEWVERKELNTPVKRNKYLYYLADLLEVIWYELQPKGDLDMDRKDSVMIFTRLNVGKIALTGAELIKAVFLNADNLNVRQDMVGYRIADQQSRQVELASDWNRIEYGLQQNDVWDFINREQNNTATRIDFVFELIARLNGESIDDEHSAFRFFYKRFHQAKAKEVRSKMLLEEEWNEVTSCYSVLEEWHTDKHLHHLIGYLIWDGKDILDLYRDYQQQNKTKFKTGLARQIIATVGNTPPLELYYNSHPAQIKRILVLFNVLSADSSKDASQRFPFGLLKDAKNKWSLEHIHAQNAEDIAQKDYEGWMMDHRAEVVRAGIVGAEELAEKMAHFQRDTLINANPTDLKGVFDELAIEVIEFLSEHKKVQREESKERDPWIDVDHISNMALLDTRSNTALGNSAFAVKRKKILDKEREGAFIPQATKNVFLKYYSDYPQKLVNWTMSDRKTYMDKMQQLIDTLKTDKI